MSQSEKVKIICSEGFNQPEKTRAEAEHWLARHKVRASVDGRMCQGTHHIEEKETNHGQRPPSPD